MPSKFKSYNKRFFVTIDEKEVPKERCELTLLEGAVADRPDVLLATDRAYQKMPDGSLRRIQPKDLPKPSRKIIVEDRP
jgi:hypothetical protein